MDQFSRDELRTLAQQESEPCISLFMSTFRFESDLSQNPIRYKNLLREVRDQLKESGYRQDRIDELLEPAHAQLDETPFWRNLSNGLAVFITPDETRFFRLPVEFDEIAIVGERFHLKPLFPLIASNNRFYVLSLSQNDVRLYQGSHQAIGEVTSAEIPSDIVDAVTKYEDPERQLQSHSTGNPSSTGRQEAEFHGQGVPSDDAAAEPHEQIKRFFRKINSGVVDRIGEESVPLVLAGVEEYLPLYRDINDYPHLVEDQIIGGNPESLHIKELHEKAWDIVEPIFNASQQEAKDNFEQLYYQDGDLASDNLHEIIPACAYSRVSTLFVPIGRQYWGRFDADSNTVEVHDEHQPGDEDLYNYAAIHAYLNGSTVHALKPDNMPGGRSLAATFRFPANVSATEGQN